MPTEGPVNDERLASRSLPPAGEGSSSPTFAATDRVRMPVLAIGGNTVGESTARQLLPITANLTSELLANSGHIVPIDAPAELAALLSSHFSFARAGATPTS